MTFLVLYSIILAYKGLTKAEKQTKGDQLNAVFHIFFLLSVKIHAVFTHLQIVGRNRFVANLDSNTLAVRQE